MRTTTDKEQAVRAQGWDFEEEHAWARGEEWFHDTTITLPCGLGAVVQEASHQPVSVSLEVNIPGTWDEPPDTSVVGEWVVESFQEAVRLLAYLDRTETERQWKHEVEMMRADQEQYEWEMIQAMREEGGF